MIGRPIVPFSKVTDGIRYILRAGCQWNMLPREYSSDSTYHRRFLKEWVQLDIFRKIWVRVLQLYDNKKGIKQKWQQSLLDSISIKSPLGERPEVKSNYKQKQTGHKKKQILTDKNGVPLSTAVLKSANKHGIKTVTDVIDNIAIKRSHSSSLPKYKRTMRNKRKHKQQHLCIDKAYNSKSVEQESLKRGYLPHIPHKIKRGENENENTYQRRYLAIRWVVLERTNS